MVAQAGDSYLILLGALDTKASEVAFLRGQLRAHGWAVRVVDIGIRPGAALPEALADAEIVRPAAVPSGPPAAEAPEKVEGMTAVAEAAASLVTRWAATGEVAGAIGIGGGVGTWIAARVMRELPFGLPKVLVSTLPFDIREHLGAKDIVVFPTVADILGVNQTLRIILRNAAAALTGMAGVAPLPSAGGFMIGATALGVTTPALCAARRIVEAAGYELVSFHANGVGGPNFEEWIALDTFCGILDLTTAELTSDLFGGLAPAGPRRLTTAAKKGVPQVVAPGGLDFVTRGPLETLGESDRRRPHHRHSPVFTHVRLTAGEMRTVARALAERLNPGRGPSAVAIPEGGFSAEDRPGGALYDPEADAAFTAALRQHLAPHIGVVEVAAHINDKAFVTRACSLLFEMLPRVSLQPASA